MRTPEAILFVDGENLTARFQAMLEAGRQPEAHVERESDWFVWSASMTRFAPIHFIRVIYYTSVVGDDDAIQAANRRIADTRFKCVVGAVAYEAQLIPRVFKKAAKTHRTRLVDINITVDVMNYASSGAVNTIVLASGDGDYLPVIQSAMQMGKNVYVLALSSGCNPILRTSVDRFVDLDQFFVKPRAA
jgi:uncharacterized LabA/DUF88 family protein